MTPFRRLALGGPQDSLILSVSLASATMFSGAPSGAMDGWRSECASFLDQGDSPVSGVLTLFSSELMLLLAMF